MKLALLTNYPLVDNVDWKKEFINHCLQNNWEIDIYYGKKSLTAHFLSYVLKNKYGRGKNTLKTVRRKSTRNYQYFSQLNLKIFRYESVNSISCIEQIKELKYDFLIAALDQIFSSKFVREVNSKILNVHYGSLPEIKGVSATEWTLMKKGKLEISLHYIDSGIDTGQIINKVSIPIKECKSFGDVRLEIQKKIPSILVDFIKSPEVKLIENTGGDLYTFMHPELINLFERKLLQ